jgi:hypothetical protein
MAGRDQAAAGAGAADTKPMRPAKASAAMIVFMMSPLRFRPDYPDSRAPGK